MVRVDVCRNLEDETREFRFFGLYHSFHSLCRTWTWGYLYEAVEKLLYSEIVQGRTEEYRCDGSLSVVFHIEFRIDTLYELKVFAQLFCVLVSYMCIEVAAVYVYFHLFRYALFVGSKEVELVLIYVIHALELRTLVDRP